MLPDQQSEQQQDQGPYEPPAAQEVTPFTGVVATVAGASQPVP